MFFVIDKIIRQVVLVFLIVLITVQLFSNRGLWLDEAMLAINLKKLSYNDLFLPLPHYGQVAPVGFLLITKFFVSINDSNEVYYRFFVYLISICSIVVVYKNSKIFSTLSFILFISVSFVNYSTEFKQYALDIFFVLLIIVNVYKSRIGILFILLTLFVWFSSISFLALIPALLSILHIFYSEFHSKYFNTNFENKKLVTKLDGLIFLIVMFKKEIFIISFLLIYYAAFYFYFYFDHPSKSLMIEFHTSHLGILNTSNVFGYFENLMINFGNIIPLHHYLLNFQVLKIDLLFAILFFVFYAYLIARCFRYKIEKVSPCMTFVLFLTTFSLGFSILGLYPFGGRFSLYFICLVAYVFSQLNLNFVTQQKIIYIKILFFLLSVFPFFFMRHPETFPFSNSNQDKNLVLGIAQYSKVFIVIESPTEFPVLPVIGRFYTPNVEYSVINKYQNSDTLLATENSVLLTKCRINSDNAHESKINDSWYMYYQIK
jgi:hypothetical protein